MECCLNLCAPHDVIKNRKTIPCNIYVFNRTNNEHANIMLNMTKLI